MQRSALIPLVRHPTSYTEPLVATPNGENTMSLLKLLALGNRELEQGQFRDAEAVFASLG